MSFKNRCLSRLYVWPVPRSSAISVICGGLAGSDRWAVSRPLSCQAVFRPAGRRFNASNVRDFQALFTHCPKPARRAVMVRASPADKASAWSGLNAPCSCAGWVGIISGCLNLQPSLSAASHPATGPRVRLDAQRLPLTGGFLFCEVRSGKIGQARSAVVYSGPVSGPRESSCRPRTDDQEP